MSVDYCFSRCPSWRDLLHRLGFISSLGITCLLLVSPSYALDVKGLPGSTWWLLSDDINQGTGTGAIGYINQGVDWFDLPGEITFNTFAEYRYRSRANDRRYFDTSGPAVGVELKKSFLRLRMEYNWEKFADSSEEKENRRTYLIWYYDWKKNMKGITPENSQNPALTGSTWGTLSYDLDGSTGKTAMGYINQGVDWFEMPEKITFNTFAEYRFRYRTEDNYYYNADGPAVGIELKKNIFRLGMDYYWELLREQKVTTEYWRAYLTFYYDWNLKR